VVSVVPCLNQFSVFVN